MICQIGNNIISSLGFTTEENYRNVKAGKIGIRRYENTFGVPTPFMASLIATSILDEKFSQLKQTGTCYTQLEKAAILSITEALKVAGIDVANERVLFVLSTTKGNVHLLDTTEVAKYEAERVYLWRSAQLIAEYFGNKNRPITVSNACISGASALLVAKQELESKRYDYAIVIGVDMLSKFIVSGFQSFLALSENPCRPFDKDRTGLNLGEAAATIILARKEEITNDDIILSNGAVRNDANHISGPSRTGEGSYLALRKTLNGIQSNEIAFVNAHGTATPYNDEMESIALTRAGLENVPVNSLKGYFGHTLGAAGVLESIISTCALKEEIALKTSGYEELGVTNPLNVTTENTTVQQKYCIKMLSGFGGCNAVLLFEKSS